MPGCFSIPYSCPVLTGQQGHGRPVSAPGRDHHALACIPQLFSQFTIRGVSFRNCLQDISENLCSAERMSFGLAAAMPPAKDTGSYACERLP